MKTYLIAMAMSLVASISTAEEASNYADPEAILADIDKLRVTCAQMNPLGETQTEVFGIRVIRYDDMCFVAGDEIDPQAREFLEEQKLPWAGVGLWVKASEGTD